MGVRSRVEARKGYLVLKLTGDYDTGQRPELARKTNKQVAAKWTDRDQPLRLLIDVRGLLGQPSANSSRYSIANEWWAEKNTRIAWLYDDPKNEAYFSYLVTAARKHGYLTREFRDRKDAVAWLTGASGNNSK